MSFEAETPDGSQGEHSEKREESAAFAIRRALKGSPVVIARQTLTALVMLSSGIALARLLTPAEFGIYALIVSLVAFIRIISEGGLGAALVSQQRAPSALDFKLVFTAQTLVSLLFAIALVIWVMLSPAGLFDVHDWKVAIAVTACALPLAPVTSNGIVFLERNLDYGLLGIVTAIQPITFGIFSVLGVWLGLGLTGIAFACVASFLLSALISRISRSPVGFTSNFNGLGGLLRFGIPFASTQLVSTLKDSVVPLMIGLTFGAAEAGIISWAQQFAVLPTIFVLSFSRYLFPIFARLTQNKEMLSRSVNLALLAFNCAVAPLALLVVFWPTELTRLIYGNQWLDGLGTLLLLSVANVFAPTYAVLMALFNGVGRPRISLVLSIIWFGGTWILVPLLAVGATLGPPGYAWTNLILQIPGLILLLIAKKSLKISFFRFWVLPWIIPAFFMGTSRYVYEQIHDEGSFWIAMSALALVLSAVMYCLCYRRSISSLFDLVKVR